MANLWDDASCIGKTDLFFSVKKEEVYRAEQICKTCPRLKECKEISVGETHGVWAGEYRNGTASIYKRRYVAYRDKHDEHMRRIEADAERLGLDVDVLRRIAG